MGVTPKITPVAKLEDINKMIFQYPSVEEDLFFAFYIYLNDEIIEKVPYSKQNRTVFWGTLPGKYHAVIFIKDKEGKKIKYKTPELYYEVQHTICEAASVRQKKTIWQNGFTILKELILQFPMIYRLAKYDYKLENQDTYLGRVWGVLTPLIQIGTFWLVFGIGLRQGRDIGHIPFVIWMLCGLIPWFFLSQGIVKGANSIFAKASTLARMKFPLSTLPLERVLVEMFEHIMMLLIMFIMLFFFGFYPDIYWLNLIYYIIFIVTFLTALSLITSVFTMLARDFSKMIQSLIRLLFYVTPILWDMDNMPIFFQKIMQFNPIYYAVQGFRESLLYQVSFWESPDKVIFFFGLNVMLFLMGAKLQVKFRNQFIDLI